MFALFRSRRELGRSNLVTVNIHGNTYFRKGTDIVCLSFDGKFTKCEIDHVAPNGVEIGQIACALAALEGAVQIRLGTVTGIGLN